MGQIIYHNDIFREYRDLVDRYWNSRALFVDECFGVDLTDFPDQVQILNALDENNHVAVKSGHKVGKTAIESWSILHYLCCRPFPKIPCTAPSKETLFNVLWAEIAKWHRRLTPIFREQIVWQKQKVHHAYYPEDWMAVARTATKERAEALQGFHADYLLRVVDEGSGVPEAIYETLEGADGVLETKELICGNPTRLEGTFFEAFGKNKALYKTFTLSSLNSQLHRIKDFVYCKRIEAKYGLDSNMYRVRVLGEFPERDGDSFIPYDLAHDAVNRDIDPQDHHPIVFGLDVARVNDQCCLAIRQGDEFKPIETISVRGDTTRIISYVARRAAELKPAQIFVDAVGMGAPIHDTLKSMGLPSYGVNVSELPAFDNNQYHRLRDELWGAMREWLFARRGCLHDDEEGTLVGQLTTPKYDPDELKSGKIVVESKKKMRARGVSSPDQADACNLTFARPEMAYKQYDMTDTLEDLGMLGGYQPLDSEAGY